MSVKVEYKHQIGHKAFTQENLQSRQHSMTYFPVVIKITKTGEERLCPTIDDIPQNVAFTILQVKVKPKVAVP